MTFTWYLSLSFWILFNEFQSRARNFQTSKILKISTNEVFFVSQFYLPSTIFLYTNPIELLTKHFMSNLSSMLNWISKVILYSQHSDRHIFLWGVYLYILPFITVFRNYSKGDKLLSSYISGNFSVLPSLLSDSQV